MDRLHSRRLVVDIDDLPGTNVDDGQKGRIADRPGRAAPVETLELDEQVVPHEGHRVHLGNPVCVGEEPEVDTPGHRARRRIQLDQLRAVETGDVGLSSPDDRDVPRRRPDLQRHQRVERIGVDALPARSPPQTTKLLMSTFGMRRIFPPCRASLPLLTVSAKC